MTPTPPRIGKKWLLLATAGLYTLLAYPLYQLWGHQAVAAMYQGRLGRALTFRNINDLPLTHYTAQADRLFYDYLWLTPLGSLLAWLGLCHLARHLLRMEGSAPPAPAATGHPLWRHDYLLAGLVYLSLTLAAHHHIIPLFGDHVIGQAHDNLKYIWTMWWGNLALRDPAASFYFSHALFYPEGANLLYNDYSWYNLILSLVLKPFLSYAAIYNTLTLHSFVLAGLGAFALARHLTQNSLASLLAGAIYAFNPSHQAHAALHMNIGAIQFIPWFALYLLKSLPQGRWPQAWAAGGFLLLNAMCDWYYLIFCLLLMAMGYAYLALRDGRLLLPGALARLGLMVGLTFLALSPWVVPMMLAALRDPGVYMGGHFDYVSDLAGLFIPTNLQWISGLTPGFLRAANLAFTGNPVETASYLGLVNLALVVYAARRLPGRAAPYLLGLLCALLLAMGPLLHLWGRTLPVALPWLALVKLPFVSNVRNPGRFMAVAYMFLAVIAALSLDHWLRPRGRSWRAKLAVCLLGLAVLAEFHCPSSRATPLAMPRVYEHLSQEAQPYGVLDLPGGAQSHKHHYMVYATFHGRPIVQGALPRQVGQSLKDRLEHKDLARQKRQLEEGRVKYVVIHKSFMRVYDRKRTYGEPNVADLDAYLRTYTKVYEDEEQLLLRVY